MAAKIYFIENYITNEKYEHGGIGFTDCEKILKRIGFKSISIPFSHKKKICFKFIRLLYVGFFVLFKLNRKSTIISLFPIYPKAINNLIKFAIKLKNAKICYIILDIDGLKSNDKKLLNSELKILGASYYLVAHNEIEKAFLIKSFPNKKITTLEFIDYLHKENFSCMPSKSFTVAYAANMTIRNFYDEFALAPTIMFQLFGTKINLRYKNIYEHGVIIPTMLPSKISGSFGLDWEGEEHSGILNILKDYSKYITHHKLSLYIISRMPIITQKGSASEFLVNKYKIGIAIHSLSELQETIQNISETEYLTMQNNMEELAYKISKGVMITEALERLSIITKT